MQSQNRYLDLSALKYSTSEGTGRRPGVYAENDGICFIQKCGKEETFLLLYRKGEETPAREIPFPVPSVVGAMSAIKLKLPAGSECEYNFRTGDRIYTDPYARQIRGKERFGTVPLTDLRRIRGVAVQKKYDWKGDVLPDVPYEDAVMYQLHVRGFTMQQNSGVRHKGTFRGLQEKLPYLKSLGVSSLRLMPAYEFEELIVPEKEKLPAWAKKEEEALSDCRVNFWGYTGGCYFAPKTSYASEPSQAAVEFKNLVRSCHEKGMEVIMEFFFGEETDFGMIRDCLEFWAQEYHVDGFAVAARESVTAELGRLPLFENRKLICAWFSENTVAHRKSAAQRMLAESNDGFKNDCRRFLKGEAGCLNSFAGRLKRNPADFAVINYMTNQDGFTMADLVSYDHKHNEANGEKGRDGSDHNLSWNCGTEGPTKIKEIVQLRQRQMKNAFAMLFLSQGTPMLLAGDEIGNSQNGNNNPYCHDSELSWVDWSRKRSGRGLTEFVQKLIAFREKHRILHMEREPYCSDMLASGYPDLSFHSSDAWFGAFDPAGCHIGCMYDGRYAGEDCFLYLACNMHWEPQRFALPQLPAGLTWRQVIDTSEKESFIRDGDQVSYEKEKTFQVPARTVVVLETCGGENRVSEKGGVSFDVGEDKRPF